MRSEKQKRNSKEHDLEVLGLAAKLFDEVGKTNSRYSLVDGSEEGFSSIVQFKARERSICFDASRDSATRATWSQALST